MCVSAEVDAAMGLVVGTVAVDAVRHVRKRSDLALASLPVVLAVHQLIEVFVWWGVDGAVALPVARAATYAYLFIAFGLPLFVPWAVAAIEPDDDRRRLIHHLGAVGAIAGVLLLAGVASGPVSAADGGHHLAYDASLFYGGPLTAVYVVATMGSFLASSHRYVVVYGILNLAAVVVLSWFTVSGFVSLWCGWAALTSLVIAWHLRTANARSWSVPARAPDLVHQRFGKGRPTT